MSWIDFIIIGIMAISIMGGYKNGFIWTLFSSSSYIFAFVFSKMYYLDLAQWMKSNAIGNKAYEFATKHVEINFPSVSLGEFIPEGNLFSEHFFSWQMPDILKNYITKEIDLQGYAQNTIAVVKSQITDVITTLFLNVLSMIIIFVVVKAIILIAGYLINQVVKLPVINEVNNALGAVIGGVRGIFIVLLIGSIAFLFSLMSPNGVIASTLEGSKMMSFVLKKYVLKIM